MQTIQDIIHQTDRQRGPGPAPADYNPYDDLRPLPRARLSDLDTGHHPLVAVAVEAARTWARRYNAFDPETGRAPWLVLSGPNGTGKTHIARAVWGAFRYTYNTAEGYDYDRRGPGGLELVIDRPTGRFWHADELMTELAANEERPGAMTGVGSIVGNAPLVVIDDVGAEGVLQWIGKEQQDYEREVRYWRFFEFCYYRANSIPGVLTTNLPLAQLAAHIGPRAWDRLVEMAPAGQMVSLAGVPSWRVKAGGR